MEALPIELIDLICQKCDQHTLLNVCLASKDVYEVGKECLLEIETQYICEIMKEMISEFCSTFSKFSRIKCVHRMMRKMLQYEHVLRKNKKLVKVIIGKLDEWSCHGMCTRKCKMYKKKFESLIEN